MHRNDINTEILILNKYKLKYLFGNYSAGENFIKCILLKYYL